MTAEAPKCGTCHPPADGTREREQLDRFADFLEIVSTAPRDEDGRLLVSEQTFRYATGEDVAPVAPT